jgi:TRAP-type C4-dicarboxylate transport system permease small subunit
MSVLSGLRTVFERLLEIIVIVLMMALTVIIVLGVVYRKMGASLVWYDEVASVMLAWLTYYGAALAALKRAHIGVPNLVRAAPPGLRIVLILVAEACVFGFFIVLAWFGLEVLAILEGDTMVSLPDVPTQLTQSVIPIGAILFMVAEALNLPQMLREARSAEGPPLEHEHELSAGTVGEAPPAGERRALPTEGVGR